MNRIICFAFVLSLVLSACGGTPPPAETEVPVLATEAPATEVQSTEAPALEPVTLTINESPLITQAPIFIADAEGYFAEQAITMEYVTFNRTEEALPLLITGDLDIYAGGINAGLFNALGQDDSIKVVADRGHIASSDPCTFQAILIRRDLYESGQVTSPAGLAGQPIGSATAGSSGFLLSTYLSKAGLTFDDVEMTTVPTAAYVDSFANKTLAAIVTPELHVTRLLVAGNAVILASAEDEFEFLQTSVLAYGKNLIADNPEVGRRFMIAYLKGVAQYNEGKTPRNLEILSERMGEPVENLAAACWVSINSDGAIDFSGVEGFQLWSVAQGDLDKAITEEQFMDPTFAAEAHNLLGK